MDGDEYEYEIDADTGEVLKAEKNDRNLLKEEKPTTPSTQPTPPATENTPKPTEPNTTEPKPTEPKPTEPKPTEPKPTKPKPAEPPAYSTAVDTPTSATEAMITTDEAVEIALKDACVSEADIRDLDTELDREREGLVYEVDFDYERNEYSYDIDAVTGEIINKRIEKD